MTHEDDVKYPNIEVQLSGSDGNAMMIIGKVRLAMKRAGVTAEELRDFSEKAMSGNYDNLLQTCMKWVIIS